ncbi:BLUF domain-containing protein [Alkanindiges illinoisensis]|uniref:BLUF domain-containing protein n=1 Tax=Alkanindiges illinoisensis TaxID=197183 RepID=UPI0004795F0F|nr:BLUF domain-containing protein [Alkanindiges illinoisensis]
MQKYQQVVFVSSINDASPLVKRDILSQFNEDAMTYFQRGDITGLLFYGNDHFFHYFESHTRKMDQLKADVLAYPYHHSQKLIYDQHSPQKQFNSWQMKYTQNDPLVQAFFARHGWERFEPYLLEGELLDEFMAIVMTYADANVAIANQPIGQAPEKHASFLHYMLGTVTLIAMAWLAFMLLSHFGYINFTPVYQQ